MKKIYVKPNTLFCEVALQQMIALSKLPGEAIETGEVLSRHRRNRRRRNKWDDEEDEEEEW